MAPWLAPIQDNLQFLMNDDKIAMAMYQEQGKIEVEALSFIRGRTISNGYIIIDEAQNLTPHEMKTIITRWRMIFSNLNCLYADVAARGFLSIY